MNQKQLTTLFLALVSAVLFMPFLGNVHLFDWDEINFAEIAREMIVTGDYLAVQINYESFTEKPPLFIWLQALSMNLWGIGEYGARFPNALAGVIVVPMLYQLGHKLYDHRFGLLWAVAWLGSTLPHLYFKSGIIDPVFNLFIFLALYQFISDLHDRQQRNSKRILTTRIFWSGIFLGLAVLTKGPAAALIALLCLGVYWIINKFRGFVHPAKLLWIFLLTCGVTLLWFGIETAINGPKFVIEFTERQWALLTTPDAGHGGFPGYHFVVLLLGVFPASAFAIAAIARREPETRQRSEMRLWMLILLGVVLVLFTLVKSKIIHYSSLAYYPLTYLAAWYLHFVLKGKFKVKPLLLSGITALYIVVFIASFALPYIGLNLESFMFLFEKDAFARENMNADVPWSYWDFIPAIWIILGLIFSFVSLRNKNRLQKWVYGHFIVNAIWVQLALFFFVGKVERITQRAAVEFYKSIENEFCYVTTYKFKSYAHLFYSAKKPPLNPKHSDSEWLKHGEIDRDVYFVCKVNHKTRLEEEVPEAQWIGTKNGFYFYIRQAKK